MLLRFFAFTAGVIYITDGESGYEQEITGDAMPKIAMDGPGTQAESNFQGMCAVFMQGKYGKFHGKGRSACTCICGGHCAYVHACK